MLFPSDISTQTHIRSHTVCGNGSVLCWHMIIIKTLTNSVSVNQFNLLLWDMIRHTVYCAVCSNGSGYTGGDLFQHPAAQLHLLIHVSVDWQAVLNWAAHPVALLIALVFRMYPLSFSLSLSHNLTSIDSHRLAVFNWSQWQSLLAPFHLSISRLCEQLWTQSCAHGHTYTTRLKRSHGFQVCYLTLSSQQDKACHINRAVCLWLTT